jgi:hypothetical protein
MSTKQVLRKLGGLSLRLGSEHTRVVQVQIKAEDCLAALEVIDHSSDAAVQIAAKDLLQLTRDLADTAETLLGAVDRVDRISDAVEETIPKTWY